jgi:hypothetical protein
MEWLDILQEYTQKSLTYSTDIFPTLQGLAKKGAVIVGNYVAGFCKSTLRYNLTWYLFPHESLVPRPQPWRAPTWSWTSTSGEVYLFELKGDYPQTFATIVSTGTKAAGRDTTGKLCDG